MPIVADALYFIALIVLSPWLVVRSLLTGRYRAGLRAKLFGLPELPEFSDAPVWFHGVSVGEVHLLTTLISAFRVRHPGTTVVVSTTTDSGFDEATKRFPDLTVIRFPFDFSWAVGRTLDTVRPRLVVLAESELWPNFLRACRRRAVPVAVVNARMSPRSFKRYGMIRWILRPLLLGRVTAFGLQSADYRDRLERLGVPAERLTVTGSIKFDGANPDRDNLRTRDLHRLLNIGPKDRVWVAGSTHAPEEEAVLRAFAELSPRFPNLRLVLAPRSPERFEAVAQLVERHQLSFRRRSTIRQPLTDRPEVILLDTIGELGFAWGLADVGFVGGSLDGKRGGQSMIEPAAYGVTTVFGPHTWNFRDTVARLLESNAAVQVRKASELAAAVAALLADPIGATRMGDAAQRLVREQQGATRRTLEILGPLMGACQSCDAGRIAG